MSVGNCLLQRFGPALIPVVAFTVGACAPAANAQSKATVVGRWESSPTSTEGIGQVIEFTATGGVLSTPGSLVQGTYHIDGANLIQAASAPPETVTVRIVFHADTMIQYAADKLDSVRLVSRSTEPATSAVGSWMNRSPTGKESFVTYNADGSFKLWVPFQTETATYRMLGDTVVVQNGKLSGRYLSSVTSGQLRLQPIGGGSKPAMILGRATN